LDTRLGLHEMPAATACRFCARVAPLGGSGSLADEVLFESTNFVVTPTLGSLVEGWVLIAPKRHYLCFGAIGKELLSELDEVRKVVGSAMRAVYGGFIEFEHGPAVEGQAVGCTVDHAHLHVVPTGDDLIAGLDCSVSGQLRWHSVAGIAEVARFTTDGLPYLFFERNGEALIAAHHGLGSQLFRRVMAHKLGRPNEYDWRVFPFWENIERTVSSLGPRLNLNRPTNPDEDALLVVT
jgi:ATP adenylyltransferase